MDKKEYYKRLEEKYTVEQLRYHSAYRTCKIWIDREGKIHPLDEIPYSYLLNLLNIFKTGGWFGADVTPLQRELWTKAVEKEFKQREFGFVIKYLPDINGKFFQIIKDTGIDNELYSVYPLIKEDRKYYWAEEYGYKKQYCQKVTPYPCREVITSYEVIDNNIRTFKDGKLYMTCDYKETQLTTAMIKLFLDGLAIPIGVISSNFKWSLKNNQNVTCKINLIYRNENEQSLYKYPDNLTDLIYKVWIRDIVVLIKGPDGEFS